MIILENPYVSKLLEETAVKNSYPVLKNDMSMSLSKFDMMKVVDDTQAEILAESKEDVLLYTNSENSLSWISSHKGFEELYKKIELFKDKIKFRRLISCVYPDFYFFESDFDNLQNINPDEIKMPVVLKPAVGFLSMGVYIIKNKQEWCDVMLRLRSDVEKFKDQFPSDVVNSSKFIAEELIDGEEFAIDAYFDKTGDPVILDIFKHPFVGEEDVSDRVYFTSKDIILSYHEKFKELLFEIGKLSGLKNFPLHMEVRVLDDKIVPIEINPMRFAGWCVTDLAYFAYGINIYEYYFEQKKPDWNNILKDKDGKFYYFTIAEVPMSLDKSKIRSVDYDSFLKNISNPLEVRKIDYKKYPVFSIVFGETSDYSEMSELLKKDMTDFIEMQE